MVVSVYFVRWSPRYNSILAVNARGRSVFVARLRAPSGACALYLQRIFFQALCKVKATVY